MRRTTMVGSMAAALALTSCAYGYRSIVVGGRYSLASRPDASYFCYDCHGYRYFDPYYDWCVRNGFRYQWSEHPRVLTLYRARYPRIREAHPDYGRHRYAAGYRTSARYREARDYESWRRGEGKKPALERTPRTKRSPGNTPGNSPKERGEKERRDGKGSPSSRRGGQGT